MSVLLAAERKKDLPLTEAKVMSVRDKATAVAAWKGTAANGDNQSFTVALP
jgi:hypothetical protein